MQAASTTKNYKSRPKQKTGSDKVKNMKVVKERPGKFDLEYNSKSPTSKVGSYSYGTGNSSYMKSKVNPHTSTSSKKQWL